MNRKMPVMPRIPGPAMDRIILKKIRYLVTDPGIQDRNEKRGTILETTTQSREGATIIAVNGRVDTATAPVLETAINKEIEQGHRKVLLNFAAVTYISSGGLRVLLATAKKLKNPGDKFGICNLSPEVLKILKLAGFTSIFSIYPSEGEALAGW
jgi:anti-anti-sigma factor